VFALGGLLLAEESTLPRYFKSAIKLLMIVGGSLVFADGGFTPAISVLSAVNGISYSQVPNLTALADGAGMLVSTRFISHLSFIANATVHLTQNSLAGYVVWIALVIIIVLFVMQPLGTGRLGLSFGPIMILWFFALLVIGVRFSESIFDFLSFFFLISSALAHF
jgi:KUP system potassium uptake protein